nr:MAG TPA: hypothetical protein [Caudoviricetes sp.]
MKRFSDLVGKSEGKIPYINIYFSFPSKSESMGCT